MVVEERAMLLVMVVIVEIEVGEEVHDIRDVLVDASTT